jgi:hypothetical protein
MGVTAAQLKAAWGAVYVEGNIVPKQLIKQLFTKTQFKEYFNIRPTKSTQEDNVRTHMTRVLQKFQAKFTALGDMSFEPERIVLERVKINVEIAPDDLAESAVQFLIDKGVDRKNMPIVQMIGMYLMMKAQEDDELTEVWGGVGHVIAPVGTAPAAGQTILGTPTPAGGARTGFKKRVIKDLNTQGKLNVQPLGDWSGLTNLETVEYAKEMYYGLPELVRPDIRFFATNETFRLKWEEGMLEKYGKVVDAQFQATGKKTIYGTNCEIKQSIAQAQSKNIWTSPYFNLVGFIKQPENQGIYTIHEKDMYLVQLGTDWYEAQGVINSLQVYSNDQDLA